MTKIEVWPSAMTGCHRLDLYHEDAHIGEYEWSSDQHMNAKIEEAEGATDLLLDTTGTTAAR